MILEIEHYSSAVQSLVTQEAISQFPFGKADQSVASRLEGISCNELFEGVDVINQDMADCCLSALWLLHGFHEQSHAISQSLHTPEGSYWHGIMHRLEGDYSNAKYWYRKVGDHPVFDSLARSIGNLTANGVDIPALVDERMAFAANDYIDAVEEDPLGSSQLLQQIEWQQLFEYCHREATGI